MARLAHNDYLEQATDAGLPAFILYVTSIVGCLVWSFPKDRGTGNRPCPANGKSQQIAYGEEDKRAEAWVTFSIWLGLLGWSLQSLFEFGLYIPALAWPAFALLGWLLAAEINRQSPLK